MWEAWETWGSRVCWKTQLFREKASWTGGTASEKMEVCESWKLNHVLSPYLRGLFLSVGAGLEAQRSIYVQLFLGAGDKLNPGSVL